MAYNSTYRLWRNNMTLDYSACRCIALFSAQIGAAGLRDHLQRRSKVTDPEMCQQKHQQIPPFAVLRQLLANRDPGSLVRCGFLLKRMPLGGVWHLAQGRNPRVFVL